MVDMFNVKIKYLAENKQVYGDDGLKPATQFSAGFDLRACFDEDFVEIFPGQRSCINTGIAIDLSGATFDAIFESENLKMPLAAFVYSRSGLGAVRGLTVAQGVGVIDPDYRGEIKVFLLNTSNEIQRIERGERIAQLVFQPFFQVNFLEVADLENSERGSGGFGASGRV